MRSDTGFWIDNPAWPEILAEKLSAGVISDLLADKIEFFATNGFLVLPAAVPVTETSLIRNEVETFWLDPLPGALCETYELRLQSGAQNVAPCISFMRGASKLLDYYAFSPRVRRAMANPQLMEFLWAVIEERPKAFQSLTFWQGSEAPLHRDTAYARMPEGPSRMIGTWLALEEVTEGAGEIEFLVGSHRHPDYLFNGESKWLMDGPRELPQFLAWWEAAKQKYTLEKFLGAEGDCLIWHADLIHSAAKIKIPGASRQSHVAHYTGQNVNPPYMEMGDRQIIDERGLIFTSEFALCGFYNLI